MAEQYRLIPSRIAVSGLTAVEELAYIAEVDTRTESVREAYVEAIETVQAAEEYVTEVELARLIPSTIAVSGLTAVEELADIAEVRERVARVRTAYVAAIPPPIEPQEMELASMSQLNIWELLDVLLPEELLGMDITPGVRVGKETKGRVYYDNVWVEDGKVKTIRKGEPRTLGYTPGFAKKKYRTRRRRKRLTKRDMYILEVMKQSPSAGALALML